MRVSRHTEKPSAFLQAPSATAWLSAYFSRMHTVRKRMIIVAENLKKCNMFCKFFENSSFNPISALLNACFHKKLHLFDKFLSFRQHYLFFTGVSPLNPAFCSGLCPAPHQRTFLEKGSLASPKTLKIITVGADSISARRYMEGRWHGGER